MESLQWNNANLHNRTTNNKTRRQGGLNKADIARIEKFYDISLPQQQGGAIELKILSLNVEFHTNMYKKFKASPDALSALSKVIKSTDSDVICLQEDVVKDDLTLTEWLGNKSPKYNLVNQCLSHPVAAGVGSFLSNSIYALDGLNVDHSMDEGFSKIENITSNSLADKRCAVFALIEGVLIANVHLTGGRYDDQNYSKLGEIKRDQLQKVLAADPDIILGDFNGDLILADQLDSYSAYSSLTPSNQDEFRKYWIAGHKLLSDTGYVRVPFIEETSVFGVRSDHIYYKPDRVELVNKQMVPFIARDTGKGVGKTMRYSDHDGLLVTFGIKNTDRPCNSLISYDCVIFQDGFSEVSLKENSLIYRSGVPLSNTARFFGGHGVASVYGDIIKFRTNKTLRLLDMNNVRNINSILAAAKTANADSHDLMQLYFMNIKAIDSPDGTFITNSGQPRQVYGHSCSKLSNFKNTICTEGYMKMEDNADAVDNDYIARKALKFICSLGFDGWIHMGIIARARKSSVWIPESGNVEIDAGSSFHDEIGICKLSDLDEI